MADSRTETLNFNVGVLGHVDSGKTSLARALSSTASTAAFDKNPQSRERGITLDLGFSSFTVDLPDHLRDSEGGRPYDRLQFTLVDCPGHASLIRTIIGGAQIIDLMMLVVDVVKGVQTQTAECLLIGELTCPRMVVVLNKTDLLPASKRQSAVEKMTRRLHKTLENTRFKDCPVIAVAAKPGGPEAPDAEEPQGVSELIELLKEQTYLPRRDPGGDLLMAVDHCFSIRGQGTVMTGTILQGSLAVNDTVEIPALKVTKKVKSIQMFRKPVSGAMQGDRVGVCVTQFDPKLLERGVVCTPGSLRTVHAAVISARKIGYFKGSLSTRAKFHVTVGHETVMARVTFFGLPEPRSDTPDLQPCSLESAFALDREYVYQEDYVTAQGESGSGPDPEQWALLEFERPVTCPLLCLVIGSKLDADIHANACRLAFQGRLLHGFEGKGYAESDLPGLLIYKTKHKEGQVERATDDYTVIGRNLFKKETNLQVFVGLKVTLSTGETGVIEGGFGQSGKFKIRVQEGLRPDTKQLLSSSSKKKGKAGGKDGATIEEEPKADAHHVNIHLNFKRYVFDPHKKMVQL
ncbi:selenocysteine-specific elongation factor [Dunckerocampus dactyliophorus]|uniref:selenocysteine-specific elongation factor n=1 Tax=Dunckerocampus dactyliophorus TaxID=161453 RepID=UPI0024054AC2|nr:selenocysteine-specific elongation factor [Dunckerocampus dactyliophorus]XP_054639419.1 selenocysteine-specific elongation factor [Dunckerocampus dactyliophorus]